MPSVPLRVGRYDIVSRLGEGGMGIVYLAKDPQLQRTVAIKMLSGQAGDAEAQRQLRQRFAREASSAAALKHHHIVTIYDVGEDEGRPFIAMEFIDGESMAELIARRPPLAVGDKLRLALELCAGLGYAHRQGIVHRDIKPANLMITGDGSLKILDFGLARATTNMSSPDLTQVGTLMGTPYYMSPEQILGKPVDGRSDIFAVGAVLYELLAYQKAFEADTPHLVLLRILQSEPPPIRAIVPDISAGLERILANAMAKDPDARYQSLDLLAAELTQVAGAPNVAFGGATLQMPSLAQTVIGVPGGAPAATPARQALAKPMDATVIASTRQQPAPQVEPSPRPPAASSTRPIWMAVAAAVVVIGLVVAYLTLARATNQPTAAAPASAPATPAVTGVPAPSAPANADPSAAPPGAATTSNPATPITETTTAAPPVASSDRSRSSRTTSTPKAATPAPSGAPSLPNGAAARTARSSGAPDPAASRGSAIQSSTGQKSPEVKARCSQLLERASLGEGLTVAERDFLAQQCRNN